MKLRYILFVLVSFILFWPAVTNGAEFYRSPELRIFEGKNFGQTGNFLAYEETFKGGGAVAIGDVTGDGNKEIIVGAGPGGGPDVRIFDTSGMLLSRFIAYDHRLNKGVTVAAGDLDGDGIDEIIIGSRFGGGPHVRIFNYLGEAKFNPGFFAYAENFRGGVNVAAGDINGDGKEEIITGSGVSGQAHVRVFDRFGQFLGIDFFPFDSQARGGVVVAAANVDGGPEDEIVMAVNHYGKAWVKTYKYNQARTILGDFKAFPDTYQRGVNITSIDVDQDGLDEIAVSANTGGGPHVKFFEAYGQEIDKDFMAYEEEFKGGLYLASGDLDSDGFSEIVTIPNRRLSGDGGLDYYKYIEVNLTEQRLYTYENANLVKTFLISSGTNKHPTPLGEYRVFLKRDSTRMTWEYGPNDPDNYDLENVPNVLSFNGPYTIHGTYWHNNFGHQMSHGCVNAPLDQAFWIYHWASLGIPVLIHQ